MEKYNEWLTSSSLEIYSRDDDRSSFLVTGQYTDVYFVFVKLFHSMHVRERSDYQNRRYQMRVTSGRIVEQRGGAGQNRMPTEHFALEKNISLHPPRNRKHVF